MASVFERKSLRMFSDADLEVDQLSQTLDQVSEKLQTPYVERRGMHMFTSAVEELNHAIKEIVDRERELKSCVEIARVLLQKNRTVIQKFNILTDANDYTEHQDLLKGREIETLKQSIETLEGTNRTLQEQCNQTMYEAQMLKQENSQLKSDIENLKHSETAEGKIEIDELRSRYSKQISEMQAEIELVTDRIARKKRDKAQLRDELFEANTNAQRIEQAHKQLQEKASSLKLECKQLKGQVREEQDKVKSLTFELNSLKKMNEKLKIDIRNVRSSASKGRPPRPQVISHRKSIEEDEEEPADTSSPVKPHKSLMMELEEATGEERTTDDATLEPPKITKSAFLCLTPTANKSSGSTSMFFPGPSEDVIRRPLISSGVLVIEHLTPGQLVVEEIEKQIAGSTEPAAEEQKSKSSPKKSDGPVIQRREVAEEYFGLACLSAKLNSPYMDSVCTIQNKILYQEAQKRQVPFHKWHLWIDDYLTEQYINNMYKVEEVK